MRSSHIAKNKLYKSTQQHFQETKINVFVKFQPIFQYFHIFIEIHETLCFMKAHFTHIKKAPHFCEAFCLAMSVATLATLLTRATSKNLFLVTYGVVQHGNLLFV